MDLKAKIDLLRQQIADVALRIEHQQSLIGALCAHGQPDLADEAQSLLSKLSDLQADYLLQMQRLEADTSNPPG